MLPAQTQPADSRLHNTALAPPQRPEQQANHVEKRLRGARSSQGRAVEKLYLGASWSGVSPPSALKHTPSLWRVTALCGGRETLRMS
jgi:hypothetical protein